jgi:hypothetical protein
MRKTLLSLILLVALTALAGCQIETPTPTTVPVEPTGTPEAPTSTLTPAPVEPTDTPEAPTPTPTTEPEITPTMSEVELPDEEIMIHSPGSGSRVINPIQLSGEADSTFEQNLVIRVLLDDGTEILETFTTIQSELGQRGPFEAELDIPLEEERNIFIQVFSTSARDGGITHLSSVGVMFSPTGPEDIVVRMPEPERIAIFTPGIGDTISGGVAVVEGYGLASFEQTLVVEVYNEDGDLIGQTPVMVDAPDLGFPGPFRAEVSYELDTPGPGRVVVRDTSPAHGDNVHLSSVEVQLEP